MASTAAEISQDLARAAEKAAGSVATVYGRHRIPSSGVYWRKGVIVTADHTLRREEEIAVRFDGDTRVSARLAGRDPSTDVAILKLDGEPKASVPDFGDPSSLRLANLVLALGRTRRGTLAASAGIVGGVGGEWRTWRGGRIDEEIRLSLELYPGFSGGPLISVEGEVLGINTNGLGRGRGVAIPVATVNRVVDELLEKGHISRPYLGIAMQPVSLPEALRKKTKSETQTGLVILHVEPSGPAESAGLLLGDVIVEVNGKLVSDTELMRDLLASATVGQNVGVTVLRGGSPVSVTVKLAERPVR